MSKDKLTPEQEAELEEMKKQVEEGFAPVDYKLSIDEDVTESVTMESESKVWVQPPTPTSEEKAEIEVEPEVVTQVFNDLVAEKPPKELEPPKEIIWGKEEDDRSRTDDLADLKGNIKGKDKSNENRRDGETTDINGKTIDSKRRVDTVNNPGGVGGCFMMGGGRTRRA